MVDLSKLSQEQRWGLQFALKQFNEAEKQELTEQQYADRVFGMACDSWYSQLISAKKSMALELFDALSPEEQVALVAQLQIPDVLPGNFGDLV